MIFEIFMFIIFMVPLYAFLIWVINNPEDSILFGRRWMYQEEPEVSANAIRYIRFASVVTMIGTPFIILSLFFDNRIFGIVLIAFILTIVIGGFFIYTNESNS